MGGATLSVKIFVTRLVRLMRNFESEKMTPDGVTRVIPAVRRHTDSQHRLCSAIRGRVESLTKCAIALWEMQDVLELYSY